MTLFIVSLLAGLLTVLAPCVLPILPVVVGTASSNRSKWSAYRVIATLAVSVFVFTFVLKVSTVFINIPNVVWTSIAGTVLILFGIIQLFPNLWTYVPFVNQVEHASQKQLGKGYIKNSWWGDVLIGASLGPIFTTCSPTYFVILATVLPASFALGTVYLLAYIIGLSAALICIALVSEKIGSAIVQKYSSLSNPKGIFKRAVSILFILLGLAIIGGIDKKIETALLNLGIFDITKVEQVILDKVQ